MTTLPLDGTEPNDWIEALSGSQRDTIKSLLGSMSEHEAAILWLSLPGASDTAGFGGQGGLQRYFESVETQLRLLLCGADEYESVRAQAVSVWASGKTVVISTISSAIAIKVGIAAAVLVPVVALILAAVGKVGLNAWCEMPPAQADEGAA